MGIILGKIWLYAYFKLLDEWALGDFDSVDALQSLALRQRGFTH